MMNNQEGLIVAIQGYEGSFHHVAAIKYWGEQMTTVIPADSFDSMAKILIKNQADIAVMAIENSIAGTILQNYRILRENGFWVNGEIYLRIRHHLLVLQDATLEDIREVASHPMAINQCREYLHNFPQWKILESEDTALSAEVVASKGKLSKACIASAEAAEIHGLKILSEGIETSKSNYTRFFIVTAKKAPIPPEADKASVYIRIPDRKGQLLKVLEVIQRHNLNMSKLQSFPVVGSFREYFFHLDIEFEHISQYFGMKEDLLDLTFEYDELGIYKSADISDILKTQKQMNTSQ